MKVFQSKFKVLSGTNYSEVYPLAWQIHKKLRAKTKRRSYVRSKYFKNSKIFIEIFWQHIRQKNFNDRTRRLKFFACAIDLLEHSKFAPSSKEDVNTKDRIYHRFLGKAASKETFVVQVVEDKRNDQKFFISVFPWK